MGHKRQVFEIDERGFILNNYIVAVDEKGNILEEEMKKCIFPPESNRFEQFKPRWDGEKWVEGESDEERIIREEKQIIASINPTPEQVADADLEIKMITLLMDMGVLQ